jgi:hypothetical protein
MRELVVNDLFGVGGPRSSINLSRWAVLCGAVVLNDADRVSVFELCEVTQRFIRKRLRRKSNTIANRMLNQAAFGDIDRNDLCGPFRLIAKLRIPCAQFGGFVIVDPLRLPSSDQRGEPASPFATNS